jgi:hypothetical protein
VGPRAGLDTEARGKILSPLSGIEPRSPGRLAGSQTLYCLSYPAHSLSNVNQRMKVPFGIEEVSLRDESRMNYWKCH